MATSKEMHEQASTKMKVRARNEALEEAAKIAEPEDPENIPVNGETAAALHFLRIDIAKKIRGSK